MEVAGYINHRQNIKPNNLKPVVQVWQHVVKVVKYVNRRLLKQNETW